MSGVVSEAVTPQMALMTASATCCRTAALRQALGSQVILRMMMIYMASQRYARVCVRPQVCHRSAPLARTAVVGQQCRSGAANFANECVVIVNAACMLDERHPAILFVVWLQVQVAIEHCKLDALLSSVLHAASIVASA